MEKIIICRLVLACVMIAALDATATIMGYRAQEAQNKAKHVKFLIGECRKPSHDAFVLGSTAVILFGIAHFLSHLGGGCKWCNQIAVCRKILLGIKWFIFVVGMLLLVLGTKRNHNTKTTCGLRLDHLLQWGANMCVAHGATAIGYCVISALA